MTSNKIKIVEKEKGIYTSNIRGIELKSGKKRMSPKEFYESLNYKRSTGTDGTKKTK